MSHCRGFLSSQCFPQSCLLMTHETTTNRYDHKESKWFFPSAQHTRKSNDESTEENQVEKLEFHEMFSSKLFQFNSDLRTRHSKIDFYPQFCVVVQCDTESKAEVVFLLRKIRSFIKT